MNNTLATAPPAPAGQRLDLSPRTFDQALIFADHLAGSDLVPKDFQRKPANCLIAMQWGAELGLQPLQAIQSIAVINGRPAMWGDALMALVRSSPVCEWVIEEDDGTTARCRVKRRGEPEQARTFGVEDARQAGLQGKSGPWTQYPKRMRQLRARAFALRDVFADVLRGMAMVEEAEDIPPPAEKHMGAAVEVRPPAPAAVALPAYSDEALTKNLPAWRDLVDSGRKTPEAIIATLETKAALSPEQRATIQGLGVPQAQSRPAVDADGVIDMPATSNNNGGEAA